MNGDIKVTHDELLAKIDYSTPSQLKAITLYAALRAVVELHRPQEIKLLSGEVADTYCYECEGFFNYPCPTIQAIEKELG
jgi:hypothetical protein